MLQYTRAPSGPVTLMQGPSTSAALRNGPGPGRATGGLSASLCKGSERMLAAGAADASAANPSAADASAQEHEILSALSVEEGLQRAGLQLYGAQH